MALLAVTSCGDEASDRDNTAASGAPGTGGGGRPTVLGVSGKGGSGGSGGTLAGGNGGSGGTSSALHICDRLRAKEQLTQDATEQYRRNSYADCRIKQLVYGGNSETFHEFLNAISAWSFKLWGCDNGVAQGFPLAREVSQLTRADLDALIDVYLTGVFAVLDLTSQEREALRAELVRLSLGRQTSNSSEYSASTCGAGGGGGMGGAGGMGGEAGLGGEGNDG